MKDTENKPPQVQTVGGILDYGRPFRALIFLEREFQGLSPLAMDEASLWDSMLAS
jgi:hypothetical protein